MSRSEQRAGDWSEQVTLSDVRHLLAARCVLLLACLTFVSFSATAQQQQAADPQVTAPAEAPAAPAVPVVRETDPEALVRASRQAKAGTKKSTRKVITNSDVKKAKAKLGTTAPQPLSYEPPKAGEEKGTLQMAEERYRDRLEAEALLVEAEKAIRTLERELAAVEQSYYDENDPEVRDTVIQRRFAETKRKLEAARRDADGIRAAVAAASPQQ